MKLLLTLLILALAVTVYWQKRRINELTAQVNQTAEQESQDRPATPPAPAIPPAPNKTPQSLPTAKRTTPTPPPQENWFQKSLDAGKERLSPNQPKR